LPAAVAGSLARLTSEESRDVIAEALGRRTAVVAVAPRFGAAFVTTLRAALGTTLPALLARGMIT
jgi:hypothetical protein